MRFLLSNRALLRGMLAGAAVLTATACSRSDRTESGSDTSAAILPDTTHNAPQPFGADTATGAVQDTSAAPAQSSSSTQPSRPAQPNSPRAETAPLSDNGGAGYRAMERDTAVPEQQADSARVTADTAEASYAAPDTSISAVPEGSDTTAMDAMGDDRNAAGYDVAEDDLANETADEQIFTSENPETVNASDIQPEEVGAAAISGEVPGTEAVAVMSRDGVRCALVDPEANEAVRWDMSSTPVTLNPCGMGSMNLSRIGIAGE